jgi:hypothetical protein
LSFCIGSTNKLIRQFWRERNLERDDFEIREEDWMITLRCILGYGLWGSVLAALNFCCINRKLAIVSRHFPLNPQSVPLTTFPIHQSRSCYNTYSTLSMYTYKDIVHLINKTVVRHASSSWSHLFTPFLQDTFWFHPLLLFHACCFFLCNFPTENYYIFMLFLRDAMCLTYLIFLGLVITIFFHFRELNLSLDKKKLLCTLCPEAFKCSTFCLFLQVYRLTAKLICSVPSAKNDDDWAYCLLKRNSVIKVIIMGFSLPWSPSVWRRSLCTSRVTALD